jgi:hypothetical protein
MSGVAGHSLLHSDRPGRADGGELVLLGFQVCLSVLGDDADAEGGRVRVFTVRGSKEIRNLFRV